MRPSKKIMTEKKIANLILIQSALMDKNDRLAKVARSSAKRKHFLYRARKHRSQIEKLNVM